MPSVCPRHGLPATGTRTQRFTSPTPAWVMPLIVLSLLIGALIASALAKNEDVQIPTCGECDGDRVRVRFIRLGLGLGGLALLVAGAVVPSAALGWVGVLLLVVWMFAVTTIIEPLYAIRGRVVDDSWLDLRAVHPNFVAALRPNPAWAAPAAPGYVPAAAYAQPPGYAQH